MWTDASGKVGMRGYILQHPNKLQAIELEDVFSVRTSSRHRTKDIPFKEMNAVLHAIQLWLPRLRGAKLTLYCNDDACLPCPVAQKSHAAGVACDYLDPSMVPNEG